MMNTQTTEYVLFLKEQLDELFDDTAITAGKIFSEIGEVSNISIEDNGLLIRGKVKGANNQLYKVKIDLRNRNFVSLFDSDIFDDFKLRQIFCDCNAEHHCSHAAAILHTAIKSREETQTKTLPIIEKLDYPITQWLSNLISIAKSDNIKKKPQEEKLLFVITTDEKDVYVSTFLARMLKKGDWGKVKNFFPNTDAQKERITPDDLQICSLLKTFSSNANFWNTTTFQLKKKGCENILEKIIQTGRCYWKTTDSTPLVIGEKRKGSITWQMQENSLQKAICDTGDQYSFCLPLSPFWYVDTQQHCAGLLDIPLHDTLAFALLNSPSLSPIQAKQVNDILQNQMTAKEKTIFPLPKNYEEIREEKINPIPCLHLSYPTLPIFYNNQYGAQFALAQLSFRYGNAKIAYGDKQSVIDQFKNNTLIRTVRNNFAEKKYIHALQNHDVESLSILTKTRRNFSLSHNCNQYLHHFLIASKEKDKKIENFTLEHIPQLKEEGWEISFDSDYPYPSVETIDEWYSDVNETSENEWFNFELGVIINNERINLLPPLIKLINRTDFTKIFDSLSENIEKNFILEIANNRCVSIPYSRLHPILNVLYELYSPKAINKENTLKISRLRASLLIEIEKALQSSKLRWFGTESLLALGKKLQNFTQIESVEIPNTFKAVLRPYQHEGVNWLQFLRSYQLNGILADDMGLGKTVQALAHLMIEKESGRLNKPCLIIAPTSVITNWRIEAERFSPNLRVLILHGNQRKDHFDNLQNYDLIITTYHLLIRDSELLIQQLFYFIILDEAQYIKNAQAKMTQIVQQLKADFRLCLTGTPLENHLGELWSLYNFLMPGLLGSIREFGIRYRNPIEKNNDIGCRKRLAQTLKPFILRRTKSQVALDLPDKTEIISNVELSGKQRDLYESIRLAMHDKVKKAIEEKGIERSQIIILDALLKLRQVCCDPRLLKFQSTKEITESAKLESLMDMLPELIQEGRRVLLFSQFTSMLSLIEIELAKYKINYIKLTGETQNRQALIDRFQNKEVPLFLISLKAGGTGLNLTAADTVIHYDPWWNPAAENQATDRAHRIGQDKAVFVYKFVTNGTVEEKILAMQEKKKNIADSVFDSSEKSSAITRGDFESLFT
jgi:SNF2 family DNA or RNA helicase